MNPNSTRDFLKNANLEDERVFPQFLQEIKISRFRNIKDLHLKFSHPLTVLVGTNKIGKTSIMAMLACSHVDFQMRNIGTGKFERCTWNRLIKFTKHDVQEYDWEYSVKFKNGRSSDERAGRRLKNTKKWSGLAKRETQIEGRDVIYIDVDRITPAHACSNVLFLRTQEAEAFQPLEERIRKYFEYIFEREFDLAQIAQYQNRVSFKLNNTFTSFNSASGEDVLLSILLDAVLAKHKSLILIDELELGLHPKLQRRLVDVLMDIAKEDQKQFIVTTHSPTSLSSFDRASRIFIEFANNQYRSIERISTNAAFSKMDSEIYPLANAFCEDETAHKILLKALQYIKIQHDSDLFKIINLIPSGPASRVLENYSVSKRIFPHVKLKVGYIAVLDGDQRISTTTQSDDFIYFLYSNEAPEKFLLRHYLVSNPNPSLQYHLENSPADVLLTKCVEESLAPSVDAAFELLYSAIEVESTYQEWLEEFRDFLVTTCKHFSENMH
jgi:predicted ATPase